MTSERMFLRAAKKLSDWDEEGFQFLKAFLFGRRSVLHYMPFHRIVMRFHATNFSVLLHIRAESPIPKIFPTA